MGPRMSVALRDGDLILTSLVCLNIAGNNVTSFSVPHQIVFDEYFESTAHKST